MPLPASITPVTLTGTYLKSDGSPETGFIKIRARQVISSSADNTIVSIENIEIGLDNNGQFSVDVIPTNDPDWEPQGWTYHVIESLSSGSGRRFFIEIPYDVLGGTLDIADAPIIPDEEAVVGSYIPLSQKGAVGGVATLDGTGKVPTSQLPAASGGDAVESVNGDTGPNVVLTAADVGASATGHTHAYIPTSEKAVADGVATLDSTGKLPSSQLPTIASGVTSVNGETGVVTLDAADVGALDDSTIIDQALIPKILEVDATNGRRIYKATAGGSDDDMFACYIGTRRTGYFNDEGYIRSRARADNDVAARFQSFENAQTTNPSNHVLESTNSDNSLINFWSEAGGNAGVRADLSVGGDLDVTGSVSAANFGSGSWEGVAYQTGAADSGGAFAPVATRSEGPNNLVRLRGRISFTGSFSSNATIATIDSGHLPAYDVVTIVRTSSGGSLCTITSDGEIQIGQSFSSGNWVALDNITWTQDA